MALDRTGQMCHAKSLEQILQLCNQRNIHIIMLVDRILFEGPSREEVQVQARGFSFCGLFVRHWLMCVNVVGRRMQAATTQGARP